MKSYTDLEQPKRLAEILPLESADMGRNFFVDDSARCLLINSKHYDNPLDVAFEMVCWLSKNGKL